VQRARLTRGIEDVITWNVGPAVNEPISILIIDDNVETLHLLGESLSLEGFEVRLASDGVQGLRLYRERRADVVITDIFMPEKDGIEIILELAQEFPGAKVIAISGGGMTGELSYLPAAQQLGAVRALIKPFKVAELLEAIRGVLAA
jgi:CheY-like chemotaxis protein